MSEAGSQVPEFITLEEAAAMTSGTRVTFIPGMPALYAEALTQRIEEHQRYILTTYCETPAVLGGDPL